MTDFLPHLVAPDHRPAPQVDPEKAGRKLLARIHGTDDYILQMDNSGLEKIQGCAAKGEYYHVLRRDAGSSSALSFGSAIHKCLERYYSDPTTYGDDVDALMHDHFVEQPIGPDDWRSEELVYSTMDKWIKKFPIEDDPFVVHRHEGVDCIELPFCRELGVMEIKDHIPHLASDLVTGAPQIDDEEVGPESPALYVRNLHVMWIGKIDMIVRRKVESQPLAILDYKTFSIGGQSFWDKFYLSQQMMGYCWAGIEFLGEPVRQVFVQGIYNRPPTKDGTQRTEFPSQVFTYTDEQVEENLRDISQHIDTFVGHLRAGRFPKNSSSCRSVYGKCPYHDACKMGGGARLKYLQTDDFRPVTWSPLD